MRFIKEIIALIIIVICVVGSDIYVIDSIEDVEYLKKYILKGLVAEFRLGIIY